MLTFGREGGSLSIKPTGTDDLGTATETLPIYIFLTTWQYFQISKCAAMSYIVMMLMVVIVLLAIRLLRREKRHAAATPLTSESKGNVPLQSFHQNGERYLRSG